MSHHEHQVHETHDHVHGPECGHTAVRHDDHVDYLHDAICTTRTTTTSTST
ncbi:MAG: hypothetical protein MSC31_09570 [Solirubrobacteraceae bacterium MAG38_C4-C5]|nr:hypothetical protein [Candidatus Siliceabacter maunaloa]